MLRGILATLNRAIERAMLVLGLLAIVGVPLLFLGLWLWADLRWWSALLWSGAAVVGLFMAAFARDALAARRAVRCFDQHFPPGSADRGRARDILPRLKTSCQAEQKLLEQLPEIVVSQRGAEEPAEPQSADQMAAKPVRIKPWVWGGIVLLLLAALLLADWLGPETIVYSDFLKLADETNLSKVTFVGSDRITGDVKDLEKAPDSVRKRLGKNAKFSVVRPDKLDVQKFIEDRLSKDPELVIEHEADRSTWLSQALLMLLPAVLLLGIFFLFILPRMRNPLGTDGLSGFITSHVRRHDPKKASITFDDVAGLQQAKAELQDIIDYLKNPEKYQRLGARLPRGILLEGHPGTGKTLLARAVAGTAGIPFFWTSASEFEELFVGVGASRLRDLFEKARKERPSIVFIDELDAIGRRREGTALMNTSYEQALNQLLTEMDGFEPNSTVVVIGATNRADVLDPALVRPGRFDKRIKVDLPGPEERLGILEIHTRQKPLEDSVDLEAIARHTPGTTGADLETVTNEAALLAARTNRLRIRHDDLEAATRKIGAVVPELRDPAQLATILGARITGQRAALLALTRAVMHHYSDIRAASLYGATLGTKSNILLYGPEGTGKTLMIQTLARELEVPYASFDAGSLAQNSLNIRIALSRLLAAAGNDARRAEYGIMCIYGLESLLTASAAGVQEELARIVEGAEYEVAASDQPANGRTVKLDTARMLFICEGTLPKTKAPLHSRLGGKVISAQANGATPSQELLSLGFVPRLLGRFPILLASKALGQDQLAEVLTRGQHSLVRQYERRMKDTGTTVTFDETAVTAIAGEAFRRGGGARLLLHLVEGVLRNALASGAPGARTITEGDVLAALDGDRAPATPAVASANGHGRAGGDAVQGPGAETVPASEPTANSGDELVPGVE